MLFKYTVSYYDSDAIIHRKAKGKAFGVTYTDVVRDLIEYYDESTIESLSVKLIDDSECVWEDSNDGIQ